MFFSKSCKAKWQERHTGQFSAFMNGEGVSHAAKRRGESQVAAVNNHIVNNRTHTVDGVEVGSDYPGLTDQEWDDACASAEMGWAAHKALL